MTRFLRFVKSAHFFAFAFACIFGVFFATNSFADCIDRSSGSYRSPGANEYNGPSNYCSYCGSQDGLSSGTQFGSGVLAYIKSCGNGTITCNNDAYKAQYNSYVYYCFPCPGASKITGDPNIPNLDNVTWSTGGKCQFTYNRGNDANGCTYHSQWNVATTENSGNEYCQGIGSVPSRPTTMVNFYTIQHGSTNSCKYSHRYQYTAASTGYHLSSDKTSCVACGTNEYSPAGNALTACYPCPYGGGNFVLTGYYGSEEFGEGFDEDNGGYLTLKTQGTGSGDTCVISSSTGSDGTGTYSNGACTMSPNDGNYGHVLTLGFDNTSQSTTWGLFLDSVCDSAYPNDGSSRQRCKEGYYDETYIYTAVEQYATTQSECHVSHVERVDGNTYGVVELSCRSLCDMQKQLSGKQSNMIYSVYID